MKIDCDVFVDSFRALSAEKLGMAVLELCTDEDSNIYEQNKEYYEDKSNKDKE